MVDKKKQNDILKAASHCFALYGFSKTTMDDIGGIVGLNKASLYYYYKSKEAIFCEIISQETEKFLSGLKEKIDDSDSWNEQILTYILERERYFQDMVNLHKLSVKTSKQLHFQPLFRDLLKYLFNRETQLLKDILDRALDKKQIIDIDTSRTANTILAMTSGIQKQMWLLEPDEDHILTKVDFEKTEKEVRFALSLILRGLAAYC